MDLLIGWSVGVLTSLLVSTWIVKRYIRNKLALKQLISEMYHKDLLPEICRVEGLIDLSIRDMNPEILKHALREQRIHKQKVLNLIKKYEPFQ